MAKMIYDGFITYERKGNSFTIYGGNEEFPMIQCDSEKKVVCFSYFALTEESAKKILSEIMFFEGFCEREIERILENSEYRGILHWGF